MTDNKLPPMDSPAPDKNPTPLAVVEDAPPPAVTEPPSRALADFRTGFMLMPKEQMTGALKEYGERRDTFQAWLQSRLTEGVHYGVPPGCEPRVKKSEKQWKNKPSLYKAGADLLVDLMGARAEYHADLDSWKQAGSVEGMYVFRCVLLSRTTGEVLGEGRGVFKIGEKSMQANPAIKMAEKRAKVDAVLNAWGLSDLFTQDLENVGKPTPDAVEPAKQDPDAPKDKPRSDKPDKAAVWARWLELHDDPEWDVKRRQQEFWGWFEERILGGPVPKNYAMTEGDLSKAWEALNDG